jgi:hypothetical protein
MNAATGTNQITAEWLKIVAAQVSSMRFGMVQVTVHESRVVQIEKTEKLRFEQGERKPQS